MAEKTVEKTFEIAMLYDFYGELLTPRQKEVLQYYYEENYSLSETAEELGVSRQAVHDTIRKAEKALRNYEQKLGLVERFRRTEADMERAVNELDRIIEQLTDKGAASTVNMECATFDNKIIEKLNDVKSILSILEEE